MTILNALTIATSQISNEYFLLKVANNDQPVKRERVYCYELYHQLRIALSPSALTLTGEPDKRGHGDFEGKKPIPDFILHSPGNHDNNKAVIEVECDPNKAHLTKDLKNLKLMKDKGYSTLILLIFAEQIVPWKTLKKAAIGADIRLTEVNIFLHKQAKQPATHEHLPSDIIIT